MPRGATHITHGTLGGSTGDEQPPRLRPPLRNRTLPRRRQLRSGPSRVFDRRASRVVVAIPDVSRLALRSLVRAAGHAHLDRGGADAISRPTSARPPPARSERRALSLAISP